MIVMIVSALAAARERSFDGGEAVTELLVSGAQGTFGVDLEVTGEVDGGEEEVAELFLDS